MHSNLMGPAGFYFHIEKRKALISPARPIKRQGAPPASHNRHPGAITWVAGDRLIDAAGAGFKAAMDQRHIGLEHGAVAELIGQVFKGGFGFRDHQQSGSISIQAVHNAWAHGSGARGKLLEMIGKSISECTGMYTRRRMDYQARRFVNDEQHIVLVDDVNGHIFRSKPDWAGYA